MNPEIKIIKTCDTGTGCPISELSLPSGGYLQAIQFSGESVLFWSAAELSQKAARKALITRIKEIISSDLH